MKSIIYRYGLIAAVIMVGLSALTYAIFGMELPYRTAEALGYLGMVVALTFVFFGVKAYRDREKGGVISFGEAFRLGALIALVPALAFFLYTVIFFLWQGPAFTEYALANMSAEQRAQFEASKELFLNPFFQGLVMLLTVYVIGLVVALVSALALRRSAA